MSNISINNIGISIQSIVLKLHYSYGHKSRAKQYWGNNQRIVFNH